MILSSFVKQLECAFIKLNNEYFEGVLPLPVITVSPDNTKGAYGWCTTWKAWKMVNSDDGHYEINICSDYLDRNKRDILATLHHEMIHLFNLVHGIKDCTRGGTYHNKRFYNACLDHGLCCETTEKYGYSHSYPLDDTLLFYDSIKLDIDMKYDKAVKRKSASKKQSMRKYICPKCGLIVRASKDTRIICGVCYDTSDNADIVFLEKDGIDEN